MDEKPSTAQSTDGAGASVASNLKREGRELAGEAKETVDRVAKGQRDALSTYVSALAHAAIRSAEDLETAGYLRSAATVAHSAHQVDGLAQRLQAQEPGELWHEIEDFARDHPVLSFSAGFVLAFGVTRFLKSSAEGGRQESPEERSGQDEGATSGP